ncbi:hypothetical protein TNCV_2674861 [Trichonephila clavipes]|nr:hypothetical protein TNCV_2674861 [Trichonephila clavipes]
MVKWRERHLSWLLPLLTTPKRERLSLDIFNEHRPSLHGGLSLHCSLTRTHDTSPLPWPPQSPSAIEYMLCRKADTHKICRGLKSSHWRGVDIWSGVPAQVSFISLNSDLNDPFTISEEMG